MVEAASCIHQGNDLDGYYMVANPAALVQFAFNYTNDHKTELKKQFPDAVTFRTKASFSDKELNQMLNYYTKLTSKKAPYLTANSKKELKLWIKALIGRNLYGNDAFYPVINETDETILKAKQVIKK